MQKNDFYFDLPENLIAQHPANPRDAARLLCLTQKSEEIEHKIFLDLPQLLKKGDLLVVNNSKVLPARLLGHKPGGDSVCELLLLRQKNGDDWECLARPGKRLRPGAEIVFGDGSLTATILETLENGGKIARFHYNTKTIYEKLDEFGKMPLPPYIRSQLQNNSDYQTVYASALGSAAAPTAGLHFTSQLMQNLKIAGIQFAEITLHVGLSTFRPVQEENIEDHPMHSEWYSISEAAADAINAAKREGRRIIAVGTTSCRTLESATKADKTIAASSGETDIFIYPGYKFKMIDGLITNFHLPESTLIMLVSAFVGYDKTMAAYRTAVKEKYHFFSFGDAMLLL